MLKIMIVDDDFIVRRGMCEAIPWAAYDCEVVAQANDGIEAIEQIEACMPDVIFCDVVMPRMNGLALLAKVHQTWPWIKMVMVSAHDETTYVRQALQQDAVDYLLKPFSEQHIVGVLASVREKISRERIALTARQQQNPQLLFDIKEKSAAVTAALTEHRRQDATAGVRALFEAIRLGDVQSRLMVTSICVELIVDAMQILQRHGLTEQARRVAGRLSVLTRFSALSELSKMMQEAVDDIGAILETEGEPSTKLVERAKRMIEEDYAENLTVSALAEKLHLSANNLQKVFKRETGETIRQYLITVRMEKAKTLLRTTRDKVYAVGEAVGYMDPDFFTQTFFRVTGMTPQQYRETRA